MKFYEGVNSKPLRRSQTGSMESHGKPMKAMENHSLLRSPGLHEFHSALGTSLSQIDQTEHHRILLREAMISQYLASLKSGDHSLYCVMYMIWLAISLQIILWIGVMSSCIHSYFTCPLGLATGKYHTNQTDRGHSDCPKTTTCGAGTHRPCACDASSSTCNDMATLLLLKSDAQGEVSEGCKQQKLLHYM